MLAQGVLVCLIAVLPIVCAFIAEWRNIDRVLEKLSELPDQRYLLPLGPNDTSTLAGLKQGGAVTSQWAGNGIRRGSQSRQ